MKQVLLWVSLMCCAISVQAAVSGKYIDYTVDGKEYQGYLAYDSEIKDLRPAVLVFPEWWGLTDYPKQRARELAQLGYVAFAVDMYGKGVIADKAEDANKLAQNFYQNFDNFAKMTKAGYDELLKQEHVDSSKIAAIGFCFGGTCALELARNGADVRGVVSFHGGLKTVHPELSKNIKGKVLVFQGDVDPFSSMEDAAGFEKEMKDSGVDYKLVIYPGAKHAFTNPKADEHGIDGVSYNAEAEKASMDEMRVFLSNLFTDKQEEK
jgi:dienelactone hydrolase